MPPQPHNANTDIHQNKAWISETWELTISKSKLMQPRAIAHSSSSCLVSQLFASSSLMKPAQSGCDVTEDDGFCCGRWGRYVRWVALGRRSGARCTAVEGDAAGVFGYFFIFWLIFNFLLDEASAVRL